MFGNEVKCSSFCSQVFSRSVNPDVHRLALAGFLHVQRQIPRNQKNISKIRHVRFSKHIHYQFAKFGGAIQCGAIGHVIRGWDFCPKTPHINWYLGIPLDKWIMNFTFLTDFEKLDFF